MRKWSGISQRSAAIIGPARSEDYVAARPGSGLFVLGDGAGGTQDGAEACRIGVRAFADGYVNTDEDLYNRAPRDLGHAGKRLWVAGMAANIAIADAKINRQIASEAATTLVAVAANEGGLTTFSAGDSRAIWATQNGGRALNSEQSGGQWNNELYNAFLGGYDVRPHSTRLTAPGTYGVDEIVRYPWGSLIQPGERGVLALYSDGIGGDAGYETVAPRTLGQNVAQRLNWEGGELAWSLVMDGLKMDDRSALVGHFACHSS